MKLGEKILAIFTAILVAQGVIYMLWQQVPALYWLGTAGIVFVTARTLSSRAKRSEVEGSLHSRLRQAFGGRAGRDDKRWITLSFIASVVTFIITAFLVATDRAISSPWQIWWWPLFGSEFLLIILSGYVWQRGNDDKLPYFIGTLLALPALTAAVVYQIGYGFDPFIHQATADYIAKFGAIFPKTPYYLAQYFSVLWLQQIIPLSTHVLEKIIWPIFLFCYPFFAPKNFRKYLLWLPGLWFFLSPVLTPYNLALLIALLAIIYLPNSLRDSKQAGLKENAVDKKALYLSVLVLMLHPLVGLPLIGFVITEIYFKGRFQKWGLIASALAVPIAFKIINFISTQKMIEIKWPTLAKFNDLFLLILPKTFQLDNLLEVSTVLVWAVPACLLIFGLWKRHKEKFSADQIMALALFGTGALLLIFARFPQVFSNSQSDYPLRLWTLGLLFILPEALMILNKFVSTPKPWLKPTLLTGLIILMIFNIFPRHDRYQKDRLYSVSASDLQAQTMVRTDAGKNKFAVLTNQMTSVAGVWEYGFEASPKKPLIYPLPTTDDTYTAYLHFVNLDNDNSRAAIKKTAQLFGVSTVYLIVPSYWNKFGGFATKARREANKIIWLPDATAFIAKYQF